MPVQIYLHTSFVAVCDINLLLFANTNNHNNNKNVIDTSPLKQMLDSVTVVYLFAFPTLLSKLGPLLKRLKHVRAVATLTYHFDKQHAIFEKKDEVHDIQVYSKIITSWYAD